MGALPARRDVPAPVGAASARVRPADSQIVDGLRRRDAEALEHLFSRYGRMIAHWARTEGQDTEDVVQDVLLKVWRSGHRLDPDTHLPAWLKTVTKNTIRNRWRTNDRRPQVPVGLEIDGADPDDPIPNRDDRMAIEQALEMLNPRERECLQLLYVSDMPLNEVADKIGASREATKSLAARARRRIRSELERATNGAAAAAAAPIGGRGLLELIGSMGSATAAKVATTAVAVLTAGALTLAGTGNGPSSPPPTAASAPHSADAQPATSHVQALESGSDAPVSSDAGPAALPAPGTVQAFDAPGGGAQNPSDETVVDRSQDTADDPHGWGTSAGVDRGPKTECPRASQQTPTPEAGGAPQNGNAGPDADGAAQNGNAAHESNRVPMGGKAEAPPAKGNPNPSNENPGQSDNPGQGNSPNQGDNPGQSDNPGQGDGNPGQNGPEGVDCARPDVPTGGSRFL